MTAAADAARESDVADLAQRIAVAIGRRDAAALRGVLAPGFVQFLNASPDLLGDGDQFEIRDTLYLHLTGASGTTYNIGTATTNGVVLKVINNVTGGLVTVNLELITTSYNL